MWSVCAWQTERGRRAGHHCLRTRLDRCRLAVGKSRAGRAMEAELPADGPEERRAGLVVEGDDAAGGSQVAAVGHQRTPVGGEAQTMGTAGSGWHRGL